MCCVSADSKKYDVIIQNRDHEKVKAQYNKSNDQRLRPLDVRPCHPDPTLSRHQTEPTKPPHALPKKHQTVTRAVRIID